MYTVFQIAITAGIFALTVSPGAPAFPILIILLVPFRLLIMNRWWRKEVLRFVDSWACREGTPEDDLEETKDQQNEKGMVGETTVSRLRDRHEMSVLRKSGDEV